MCIRDSLIAVPQIEDMSVLHAHDLVLPPFNQIVAVKFRKPAISVLIKQIIPNMEMCIRDRIYDALDIAADKVEIENVPVREALDEACRTAQKALDEAVR